ncbi:MAG TPA: hypothetical protein VM307_10430 [Egibacteraceae bacterium]|nr:hypothetical protein [Egibacteraceae bacterium]
MTTRDLPVVSRLEEALRELRTVTSPEAAAALLQRTIVAIGGRVVAATEQEEDVLPVDVSLGVGCPKVVVASPLSVARLHLERHLPQLHEDFRAVAARLRAQGERS